MTDVDANVRSRLTSGNRASEPYDAVPPGGQFCGRTMGKELETGAPNEGYVPRLSAAMTTPSLNFRATTDVPVTTGDWVCVVGPLGRM